MMSLRFFIIAHVLINLGLLMYLPCVTPEFPL